MPSAGEQEILSLETLKGMTTNEPRSHNFEPSAGKAKVSLEAGVQRRGIPSQWGWHYP